MNKNILTKTLLVSFMVVAMLATLTMTTGAYVDGSGTDAQSTNYMVYYPFSISAYAQDVVRTMSYAVDSFYTLGSFGEQGVNNSSILTTETSLGNFGLYHDGTTGDFVFMLQPTNDTDFLAGSNVPDIHTQLYMTGIGFDRVNGYNEGMLSVEVNQDMYDEGYLYIDYFLLDGSGNIHELEYEDYVPVFEVNTLLESLCGDYLALYVKELSYEVSYAWPPDYPSTYDFILRVEGNGYRSAGYQMTGHDRGVKDGAWWGELVGSFRNVTDYSFGDWISTAFGGFFGTELFGLFSLGDILLWVLGIGLIVVFIKMFAGG